MWVKTHMQLSHDGGPLTDQRTRDFPAKEPGRCGFSLQDAFQSDPGSIAITVRLPFRTTRRPRGHFQPCRSGFGVGSRTFRIVLLDPAVEWGALGVLSGPVRARGTILARFGARASVKGFCRMLERFGLMLGLSWMRMESRETDEESVKQHERRVRDG